MLSRIDAGCVSWRHLELQQVERLVHLGDSFRTDIQIDNIYNIINTLLIIYHIKRAWPYETGGRLWWKPCAA